MGLTAVFGITNDGLNLAVNLLLLFLVVFYVALVYWTYADARRRISDPLIVGCATAASLFPFVGTIVYMIVRPPEYLEDVRERQLEISAAEARLANVEQSVCPYCSYEVESSFLRCPSCLRRLKEPCGTCGKPLDPRWPICPYCEAEVGQRGQAPQRRERRQRRERPPAEARGGESRGGEPRPARAAAEGAEGRPARAAVEGGEVSRERSPARRATAEERVAAQERGAAAERRAAEQRAADPSTEVRQRAPRQAASGANDRTASATDRPAAGGTEPPRQRTRP